MLKDKLTKQEISWILYDVANSSFVLIIVTTIMPIFFNQISMNKLDKINSTAYWAFANTISSIIIAVLSPILGALADYKKNKKVFFAGSLLSGLIFTFLLIFIFPGEWLKCIVFFIFANAGWASANIFYDSFIVDVTQKKKTDWISSLGFAYGYIGSVAPFIIVLFLIILGKKIENTKDLPLIFTKTGFLIVVLWWFVFSLPLLFNVKQKFFLKQTARSIPDVFIGIIKTIKEIFNHKQVFLFLIAYFFYIDGVDTIIRMAIKYGLDMNLSADTLILVILFIQIVAFPFSIFYGISAKKFSAKKMLFFGIFIYIIITFIGFLLPFVAEITYKTIIFWILAFLVATSQGGIQALSRSFFSRLIPEDKSGEFFGFYNIFGKFSVIIGPLLMGSATLIFKDSKFGILSILILLLAGAFFLLKVKET